MEIKKLLVLDCLKSADELMTWLFPGYPFYTPSSLYEPHLNMSLNLVPSQIDLAGHRADQLPGERCSREQVTRTFARPCHGTPFSRYMVQSHHGNFRFLPVLVRRESSLKIMTDICPKKIRK